MRRFTSIAMMFLAAALAVGCRGSKPARELQTEQFTLPIPDRWEEIPLKNLPAHEVEVEAAIASPVAGGIVVTPLPGGLSGAADCAEIARAHAALDGATPEQVPFAQAGKPACRWRYSKPPLEVITTVVESNRLVQCAIKPGDDASHRACDQVATGFSVKP